MHFASDRRQVPNFRRAAFIHLFRTSALGGLIIVFLLVASFWYLVLKPRWEIQDLQGVPYRSSFGIITESIVVKSRSGMGNANVFVKMDGMVFLAEADLPVHAGQEVRVTYRVGHSGAIYVGRIAPLSVNR